MKKLLFVITKSAWGGAGRYVFDLATSLSGAYDVAVAIGGTGPLAEKLKTAGIRIIPLPFLGRDLHAKNDRSAFFELLAIFKKEKPDIVHLNSSKAGGLGALAARLQGVPRIVFTAHGWPFQEKRSLLWRTFAYLGSWATALLSDRVICVSEHDLAIARRMPFIGHKAVRIYNGIETMVFASGEKIRNAFPPGSHITGTIGELTKNKNHIALIEAARDNVRMQVAIVGEGELRDSLSEKIREYGLEQRVKLMGFMPAGDVLKGFDDFALPSLKEGLPYVLLEARAAGLRIEAARVGGVPEILDKPLSEFSFEKMISQTENLYRS